MANILQIMLSNTFYINKKFFKWKLLYYDSNFTEISFWVLDWQEVITGLVHVMV